MIVEPDVIAWGNNVYIVACAHGPEDIIFKRSTNNGGSWTSWIFVITLPYAPGITSIETNGGSIHIVYKYGSMSGQFLKTIRSNNGGDTWTNEQLIYFADTAGNMELMNFVASSMDGSNLHVVYNIEMTNSGVYSNLYGKIASYFPWLSNLGVDVFGNHVVWEDHDENDDRQLFSNRYGQITDYPSNSMWNSISGSGDIIHILWIDDRDGNQELYYCQRGLYADLAIDKSDILLTPPSPVVIETPIFINATVLSYSKSTSDIEVKFYDGDPDINNDLIPDISAIEIGNDTVNITKDSSSLASIQWNPISTGTYNIFIWVDPNNTTQEYNYSNNIVNTTVEIVPGIFIKNLDTGWNFISIPLEISNKNLTYVLQSIEGYYDSAQLYEISDNENHWKHYQILKPSSLNDFKFIDQYKGLFLHITKPGGTTLTIIDNKLSSSQNITIYTGWNLIGYPSLTDHNRTIGMNNLEFGSDVDCIQWFDSFTKTWHNMGINDSFEVGRGYWFHSKIDAIWEVPL
jgi:hypothetical protein